ncbi:MAG: UbiA family prenyltransferase [Planctomycetota bacterium]|jgi:protoheme IX farnesyltransferase
MNAESPSRTNWLKIILELTRFRITIMVTLTTATGYILASGALEWKLWKPLLGTFLLAAGASALNQLKEADIDARMKRTRNRPIPSGRIKPSLAFIFALILIHLGVIILISIKTNTYILLGLSGFAVIWYNGVYTRLKRITAFAVVPGALIGAIPPLIGYASAGGSVFDSVILLVAVFFFIWQIPHFWLLLLLIGDEYSQAGLATLTDLFSRQQLFRITFIWILATAVAGMVFTSLTRSTTILPWNLLITLASLWLAFKAWKIFLSAQTAQDRQLFRQAFIQINVYALVVAISLSLNALGITWQ